MNSAPFLSWREMRRRSVPQFTRAMARRHPELERQILWDDFVRICEREGVRVRVVRLSRPARLLRYGHRVFIQLSDALSRDERTVHGMHELCHFWRDDPGEPCYHAEDDWTASSSEDFANVFAWLVTSPAGTFLRGPRQLRLNDEW